MARKLNLAATLFLSEFLQTIVPFCRSAQLTDLAGFGPTHVFGSRSRHTLSIGQSQSLQSAGNMLLVWLVLDSPIEAMSVFCPRNSLSVTVTRGPVTTLLSSYALRSELSACFRSSRQAHYEKSSRCTRMSRGSHASGKSSRLQNLSLALSPTWCSIQRTVHRLSQFPEHAWRLCLGILVWHSDANVAHCTSVRDSHL